MLHLIPLDSGPEGPSLALAAGQRLGRHARCELTVDDPSISRLHARVVAREGHLFLVDADSRNGLWLGGRRVPEVELVPGAELAVGRVEMKVQLTSGGVAPAAVAADVLDEDLEFEDDLEAVDGAGAGGRVSARTPASGVDAGLALEDPAEIQLEERAGSAAATPASASVATDPRAVAEARRAALVAEVSREPGGLLRGDLTQYPGWVQGLVWVGVLALFAGAVWLALTLVRG